MCFRIFIRWLSRRHVPQPSEHLDEDLFGFLRRDSEPFCEPMNYKFVAIVKNNVKTSYW